MAAATPWAATTDKVLKAHKVSTEDGLSDDQVTVLREKYGSTSWIRKRARLMAARIRSI